MDALKPQVLQQRYRVVGQVDDREVTFDVGALTDAPVVVGDDLEGLSELVEERLPQVLWWPAMPMINRSGSPIPRRS